MLYTRNINPIFSDIQNRIFDLDHPDKNKKERPKQKDHKMLRKESPHPGLRHPGRNIQQGPPPPGLEHLETGGGQTPWTGASGTEQGAGAAAPRSGKSEDKRRPNATDWIIRGGTSSTSCRTPGWIIQGQRAARCPGLEHPGWNRQQEPPHPRHESGGTRGGQTPWTRASGAEQEGAATTAGAAERWYAAPGILRRGPHPPGWSVQGKVAARGEGNRRPRPRWCGGGDKTGSNAEHKAEEKHGGREVDEAKETQGSKMRTGPWCRSKTDQWIRPG